MLSDPCFSYCSSSSCLLAYVVIGVCDDVSLIVGGFYFRDRPLVTYDAASLCFGMELSATRVDLVHHF